MKKIVIAIIALLILGGGGFGAYKFFNKPAEANESKDAKKEEKQAEADPLAVPTFVEMKPLVLPVVDKDGVSQVISIVVSLETDTPEKAKEVELLTPRLTDAYIQGMYGVLNSSTVMEGGVLQVGYIKNRLSMITNKVMGDDKVKNVLLQVVQQRHV